MNDKLKRFFNWSLYAVILFNAMYFVANSITFVVFDYEDAYVKTVGEANRNEDGVAELGSGLHFYTPLLQSYHIVDMRKRILQVPERGYVTSEKKTLKISSFATYKVEKPLHFMTSTKSSQGNADVHLSRLVLDAGKAQVGSHSVLEVISGAVFEKKGTANSNDKVVVEKVAGKRPVIIANVEAGFAGKAESDLGIKVLDYQFLDVSFDRNINRSIFDKMNAEREAKATAYIETGKMVAEGIRSSADLEASKLRAAADQEARTIRGEGDSEAQKIYNDSYLSNPKFYNFVRSIQSYKDLSGGKFVLTDELPYFDTMRNKVQ